MMTSMDDLRFEIAPAKTDEYDFGFQVQIFVNDVEMTSRGAGLGMDTSDVLLPTNRFASPGTSIPVARCACGVYGCGVTDVDIEMDHSTVTWTWKVAEPMDRPAVFDRAAYDAEIARLTTDHSRETRDHTVARLVMTGVDHDELRAAGLTIGWVATDYEGSDGVRIDLTDHVALRAASTAGEPYDGDGFVVSWDDRTPEAVAALMIQRIHELHDAQDRVPGPVPEYKLEQGRTKRC
jgi:hypothetical protein